MTKAKMAVVAQNATALLDSTEPSEVAASLESKVAEWDNLTKTEKHQIVAQHISIVERGCAPQTDVVCTEGGYQLTPQQGQGSLPHVLGMVSTFATSSGAFTSNQVNNLLNYLKRNLNRPVSADDVNAALAFVAGCKPENEMQSALALQMFMVQESASRALGMLGCSDSPEFFGNLSVKLMRTYTMQAEAMAKLQRGGVQTVKHIHIDNRGGQAVVADTVHSGGQNARIESQPYEPSAALPCQNAAGVVVPMSCYTGPEALPDSRRG